MKKTLLEQYMEIPDTYRQDWHSGVEEYEVDLANERELGDPPSLLDFDGAMRAALSAATSLYEDEPDGFGRSHWFLAGWMAGWFLQSLLHAVSQ